MPHLTDALGFAAIAVVLFYLIKLKFRWTLAENRKYSSDYWVKKRLRNSAQMKQWRLDVLRRDHFTCQMCGIKGGYLEAHHIKPFAYYPELRLAVSNGMTLCKLCHIKTDSYGSKAKLNYGK